MPRFAANLTLLFTEAPFLDRFAAAARAGFTAVECQFPYAAAARDIKVRLDDHGLQQVLINMPAGDWGAGDRGIACDPGRRVEFEAAIDRALEYATVLACPHVNCLAGVPPAHLEPAAARATFVENLARAAHALAQAGRRLLIEPINSRDIPGFFLTRTSQAVDIIREVGSEALFLQYDTYHMQIMEGDLSATLQRHRSRIAHVQIADTPGRHEPGTGEINYDFVLHWLDRVGYDGWVGLEYNPAGRTLDGLRWARRWGLGGPV
jgi:hydroxypyruvate isomerase